MSNSKSVRPNRVAKPVTAKAAPRQGAKTKSASGKPVFERVYEIVMRIPRGRVLTYGLISDMLGGRLSAQGVGWALKALPDGSIKVTGKATAKATGTTGAKSAVPKVKEPAKYTSQTVPWQRVINSQGRTSTHKVGMPPDRQRDILEAEGVVFDHEDKVDLKKYLWMTGLRDLS